MLENPSSPDKGKTAAGSIAQLVQESIDAGLTVKVEISAPPEPKPSLAAALEQKFKTVVQGDN